MQQGRFPEVAGALETALGPIVIFPVLARVPETAVAPRLPRASRERESFRRWTRPVIAASPAQRDRSEDRFSATGVPRFRTMELMLSIKTRVLGFRSRAKDLAMRHPSARGYG